MRSIPEKTLEHWTSRELARRFPNAALWWPSNGEDVMLDELGGSPGKWFMLEVKTTEWEKRNHCNRLTIDLEQLDTYVSTGMPVFYVFPVPPWDDVLTAAQPWLGRWRRGDIGNPVAAGQWFAHWTYVLSAHEVAARLRYSWPTNKHATLLTSSIRNRPTKIQTQAKTLNQFLHLQAQCGDPISPAALVVPRNYNAFSGTVSRAELASTLRELTAGAEVGERRLAHFMPTGQEDQYEPPWVL